jgi:hypothetical protein
MTECALKALHLLSGTSDITMLVRVDGMVETDVKAKGIDKSEAQIEGGVFPSLVLQDGVLPSRRKTHSFARVKITPS